jgi:ubiquinone/menaquinone biosynthesis C-methylase UbiE
MSTFQSDFDRIALVSPEGELHNEHYHKFLLKQLPEHCDHVLEIGCGTGTFARALAARSNHV